MLHRRSAISLCAGTPARAQWPGGPCRVSHPGAGRVTTAGVTPCDETLTRSRLLRQAGYLLSWPRDATQVPDWSEVIGRIG